MGRGRGAPAVHESLREYGRGLAGGFLFSLPLLYTMEVWWAGLSVSSGRLLLGLAGTFLLLCAYNAYAGLRHDSSVTEVLIDSVEELGLGFLVSAAILLMLARFSPGGGPSEILGQVVLEGLFVAIGVSVGTAQLAEGGKSNTGFGRGRHDTVQAEVTLAVCGAVLIAANVAPTEEIVQLASGLRLWHTLLVVLASLVLAMTLLYFSNFRGSGRFGGTRSRFAVLHGSTITYAVALAASAALLWFFGRFERMSLPLCIAQSVVLGLPATLGASAGRLLLR